MRPAFLDNMSWEMAEVYGSITDQILINLARHFPFYETGNVPKSAFAFQAAKLAEIGQVNRETIQIIKNGLRDADEALTGTLEGAIISSVRHLAPEMYAAAKKGIFNAPTAPILAPNQMRAFQLYYHQAADKLNLVNTVMLESTKSAYQQAVSGIVSEIDLADRLNRTQTYIDAATGEVVTGVSSWNQALRNATKRMVDGGIIGFIDHAGHRWSAEAYVAMDIRTTVFNTGRSAVWEMNESFGNDLYMVSYHDGARPLCYDWQNKVISSTDNARETTDLDGNTIRVYAQSETTYGEPAGLFGINCKHYPTPFIPGVSIIRGNPQNPEDNEQTYRESQEQRRMERTLREQKRDLQIMKAQGASDDEIKTQRERCKATSQKIDDFCAKTGRARHRDRESVYTGRSFPAKDSYDVTQFAKEQQQLFNDHFKGGGTQSGYTFGQMTPNVPITPIAPPTPAAPVPQTVPESHQRSAGMERLVKDLEANNVDVLAVKKLDTPLTTDEIIDKISGADKTKGSCASLGLTYAGNKVGLDVTDFRGGGSQFVFSNMRTLQAVARLDGVDGIVEKGYNDFTTAQTLLKNVEPGKEYFFTAGKHAAIVRKTETGLEYLELQSGWRKNTWYDLTNDELKRRFGCQKSHTFRGHKYETSEVLFDIDKLKGNKDFEELVQYLNTAADKQKKGVGGGEK